MKIIFKIKLICLIGLMLLAVSCKKDFLDLKPTSSLVSGTLTTSQDAENLVTGAYSKLATNGYFQYGRFFLTEGINDNHYVNGDNPQEWQIENFSFDASNGVIGYQDIWSNVAAANAVLSSVPDINDPKWGGTTRKEQILAEASFLRALNYYELVTQWGGVPIITSLDQGGNYYPSRNTEAEVYAQIIKDLVEAETVLPATPYQNQFGRATKGAAQALLAKTYAQMGDYTNCLLYANKVISSGTYSLVPDFGNLWGNTHKNTAESIFEIQVPGGGTPYNFFGFDIFVNSNFQFPKRMIGTKALVDAFAASCDTATNKRYRRTINFAYTPASFNMPVNAWDPTKPIPFMYKYPDPNGFASDDNIMIMRLADIILLAAEAHVQLVKAGGGGSLATATTLLNQVRTRAGLPNTTATTQSDLALAVLNERRLELVFECTRWNDLKRADKNGIVNLVDIMNNQKNEAGQGLGYSMAADRHQLIFPIPNQDLLLNKNLTQNPGY
ncbi:MAG: RagB/SusD family nutrient uptake outer membrane protein [Ferruginibacter sp.]